MTVSTSIRKGSTLVTRRSPITHLSNLENPVSLTILLKDARVISKIVFPLLFFQLAPYLTAKLMTLRDMPRCRILRWACQENKSKAFSYFKEDCSEDHTRSLQLSSWNLIFGSSSSVRLPALPYPHMTTQHSFIPSGCNPHDL